VAHLLDGAYTKLDNARQHLGVLEAEIARLRKEQARAVEHEPDPETGDYLLRVHKIDTTPRLRTLVGDVLSNVRPPLDYLVRALAIRDAPSKRPKGTQFTIADTHARFNKRVASDLAGLSQPHVDQIEQLQPYHRRQEWLARLRELSNPDKHDFPVSVLAGRDPAYRILREKPPEPPGAKQRRDRLQGSVLRRAEDDDVAIYLGLRLTICFKEGDGVLDTLRQFESGVRGILHSFHRDLV
jgi:glycerol-3-phosphate O-acyltransferase